MVQWLARLTPMLVCGFECWLELEFLGFRMWLFFFFFFFLKLILRGFSSGTPVSSLPSPVIGFRHLKKKS